jgi:hypothetical protein
VFHLITAFLSAIRVFFRNRMDNSLEVIALRQQIAVLKRKRPRPSLKPPRPHLLDHAAVHMAAMVGCFGHCETRDGGRMASGGLSLILALAIAAARGPA